ncbi:hypothetical protein [Chryseosolibacter indicus]|uniref:Uncharacterized protein n=1 Tax=Chryseosolibacter indicus TaxID=2782351 RepID=A0ABS5VLF1_9BACT|nr:hypothetical protein [Chryseosolibacter indicus]MBT1702285.1 hypothetical protein [Chryseosolibacter indicus]
MNKLIYLLTTISLSAFGQDKALDLAKHLKGDDRNLVESFIAAGNTDFIFVDRMHPGLMYYPKYDSCKDETFLKFILVNTSDANNSEFIKYDNCGQSRVTVSSKALKFYAENREQIVRESVEERVSIDHTVFYSLYEFRGGKLMTYKFFCKECVDRDNTESIRTKNQDLKIYKFFSMLDIELLGLIR